jgi:hypothetical protein
MSASASSERQLKMSKVVRQAAESSEMQQQQQEQKPGELPYDNRIGKQLWSAPIVKITNIGLGSVHLGVNRAFCLAMLMRAAWGASNLVLYCIHLHAEFLQQHGFCW